MKVRIAAQGVPNTEQNVVAGVDLAESRINGSTIPLMVKRRGVYERSVVGAQTRPPSHGA